jgi:hypothetical protein
VRGYAWRLCHQQRRAHAAQVVAGHVAEELVAAGLQVDEELLDGAGPFPFDDADGGAVECGLVDGQAVGAQREVGARRPYDQQLVRVRPAVVEEQANGPRMDARRGNFDVKVALGHANGRAAGCFVRGP